MKQKPPFYTKGIVKELNFPIYELDPETKKYIFKGYKEPIKIYE